MALMDYAPAASELPQFIAGVLLLVIALVAVILRFSSRAARAFALFLVLSGFGDILLALDNTPRIELFVSRLAIYAILPQSFALLYLMGRYRERKFGIPLPRWQAGLLFVLGGALDLAYLLDHRLVFDFESLRWGPLALFLWLPPVVAACGGLFFCHAALRRPERAARRGGLLAALAFSLRAGFLGARGVLTLAAGQAGTTNPTQVIVWAVAILPVAGVAILLARADRNPPLPELGLVRRGLGALLLAAGSGAALGGLRLTVGAPQATIDLVDGIWQLAFPMLMGYAILRHGLFELDMKIKRTVQSSLLAAAFVATFFAAGEVAQLVFSEAAGPYVGVMAASALLFGIHPLQRLAERLSSAALPGVKPISRMTHGERLALFREEAEAAWADRHLDVKERRMLDILRVRLALTADEALRVEGEAASARARGPPT